MQRSDVIDQPMAPKGCDIRTQTNKDTTIRFPPPSYLVVVVHGGNSQINQISPLNNI